MTCIVGISHATGVVIAGDSAGVAGLDLVVRRDPKVFALEGGTIAFGFTSSFRMGDALRYRLRLPQRHPSVDVDRWMRTDFIDAVRDCLKTAGFARIRDGAEEGGTFLVGYAGRVFKVEHDFQVGESSDGFDACGCGQAYALGALYALNVGQEALGKARAEVFAKAAVAAAAAYSAGVRPPVHFAHAFSVTPLVEPTPAAPPAMATKGKRR